MSQVFLTLSDVKFSVAVYYPFIALCFKVCQTAAIVQGNFVRVKVIIEVVTVALIGVTFMLEVVNALDYIQGTRLALINYSKWVAGVLLFMCATKLLLLYFKWTFFIHQWTDRIDTFKNELTTELITEDDHTIRGLAMILTILIHDCLYKLIKIFFFSRYKPAGLSFTTTQLLSPVLDLLVVFLSFFTIIKRLLMVIKTREDVVIKHKHMLFTSLYMSAMPICLRREEQEVMRYRRRRYGDKVEKAADRKRLGILITILFIIPLFYMAFKALACTIELMMSLATYINQYEVLLAKQVGNRASSVDNAAQQVGDNSEVFSNFTSTLKDSYDTALIEAEKSIAFFNRLFPFILEKFKSRTCVEPIIDFNEVLTVNYQPTPL